MKGGTGPLILVALFTSLAYGIPLSKCFIRISNRMRPFRETLRTTPSQHACAESVVAYHSSKMSLPSSRFGGRSEKSKEPRVLVSEGMELFRRGDVEGSIMYFDEALLLGGAQLEPYLWQRGLSLYYAGRYREGAEQFRKDVAVNPADIEEAIWAFLCEAQVDGFEEARRKMLIVQTDPRPYMRRAYELFRGKCSEEDLAKEGANLSSPAAFYALLYLGLYAEARDEADKARNYIHASVATPYGKANRDYMAGLARVHLLIRKWI